MACAMPRQREHISVVRNADNNRITTISGITSNGQHGSGNEKIIEQRVLLDPRLLIIILSVLYRITVIQGRRKYRFARTGDFTIASKTYCTSTSSSTTGVPRALRILF